MINRNSCTVLIFVCLASTAQAEDSSACFGALPAQARLPECNKLIDRNPKDAAALLERAKINIDLEHYTDALADANRVIEINPKSQVAVRLSHLAQAKSEPRATLQDLDRQIEKSPQSAELYFMRSGEYLKIREIQKAIEDNDRALKLGPGTSKYYHQRADILYRWFGKKSDALAALTTAIERDPQNTSNYELRIVYRDREKDTTGADSDFEKILEIESRKSNNESGIAFWRRWRAYELSKYLRYNEAVTELNRVIAANPKDLEALDLRGYVQAQDKKLQVAILDWNQVLAIDPKYWKSYGNRCAVQVVLGDFTLAVRDCGEGIKLNPKYPNLFKHRGVARLKLGQETEGIADIDEAIKLSGSNYAAAFVVRAEVYERQNHLAEAISHFELALKSTERPGNLDDITARETARAAIARLKGAPPK